MSVSLPRRRALALTLGACAVPLAARAQSTPAVRVAATANDTFAEAYYAQDLGFFKKEGLDATLLTFANGGAVATAVASGAADFGVSNPVTLAGGIIHGIPFTIVAGGGMYSTKEPTTVLCVAKSAPIRSAADFAGKTIAVSALKDLTTLGAKAWLTDHGVDPAKVTFIEMPFAEMGPALARGSIAGAVISEPSLSAAKRNGLVRVFGKAFDAIAPQFLIGAWFTTTPYAQKNPDAVKRFVAAIYDAARWANAHHEQSAAILAKYSKIDAGTARTMARSTYALSLTPGILQPLLDVGYKDAVLDRSVAAAEIIFH